MSIFAELLEQSSSHEVRPGDVITARIIALDDDYVIVNAGLKSEGVIESDEFTNEEGKLEIQPGDTTEVVVESLDNGFGEAIFSRIKYLRIIEWKKIEEAFTDGKHVQGIIVDKVKGGFTVAIGKIKAFLPGSLIDVRPVRDISSLEGQPLEFAVIKMDERRNNIVVSRRAVIEAENTAERQALLENLKEGEEIVGVVKNITDYGAFIDLGGIDGLLHITDISWKRVKHPSDVFQAGDEVKVKVLKFDRERKRVSLGMKQLGEDPWSDLIRRYPEGSRLFGKVTNITDYGCFVEIEDGVEGLVHMSEMDWTNKNIHPSKVVSLGQEVEVMVLEIDEERRRISLGMKQCQSNPWQDFSDKHAKGDTITGKIKSITDFGIFVGLEGSIDGLIHLSDISWDETGEKAVKSYKKGDEVTALILGIDPERERISLGIKQLESDPFTDYVSENGKGTIVDGTVKEVDEKSVTVTLAEGIEATMRASEISVDKVDDARTVLKEGDAVNAKITNVDKKNRAITLSIKAKDVHETAEAVKKYTSGAETENAKATLGDILKQKMENKEDASE